MINGEIRSLEIKRPFHNLVAAWLRSIYEIAAYLSTALAVCEQYAS
jgi:hypothetical protein